MLGGTYKTATLFILGGLFAVMLLIVVLPDVDLPDTAFHRGTAPAVVHSQATAAPALISIVAVFHLPNLMDVSRTFHQMDVPSAQSNPNHRLSLFCFIRC